MPAEEKGVFVGRIAELEGRVRMRQTPGIASARTGESAGNATVMSAEAARGEAMETVSNSSRKLGDVFSAEWIKNIAKFS